MKVYRWHGRPRCVIAHGTYAALAKCVWPRAATIIGEGPFASISYCRRETTVHLYPTAQGARDAMRDIDRIGCGGLCIRKHDVVQLTGVPA